MTKKIEVFASEALPGELEDFPDIKRGWGTTKESTGGIPPMKWFNAIQKRTDEAINALATGSINGHSFEEGAILESKNDFIYDEGSKLWYFWIGESGKVIPPDSNASEIIESDGGIWSDTNPDGKWVNVGDESLRGDISSLSFPNLLGISTYNDIRNYVGTANRLAAIHPNSKNIDATYGIYNLNAAVIASDDGAIILVDKLGRRWVRQYTGNADIRWWGAIGDGVFDNYISFNQAFKFGGDIDIPSGKYRVSGGYVRLYSNSYFTGGADTEIIHDVTSDRWQDSILFMNGPLEGDTELGGYENTKNIFFKNIKFNGEPRASRGLITSFFGIAHHYNISWEKCEFINHSGNTHAVEVNSTRRYRFIECVFDGYDKLGVNQGTSEYVNIDVSTKSGFPLMGPYDNTPCDDGAFLFCEFKNGDVGFGMHQNLDGVFHGRLIVQGNKFTNMNTRAANLTGFDRLCIYGKNEIENMPEGFRLLRCNNATISDNAFKKISGYPVKVESTAFGIAGNNNSVCGNSFEECGAMYFLNQNSPTIHRNHWVNPSSASLVMLTNSCSFADVAANTTNATDIKNVDGTLGEGVNNINGEWVCGIPSNYARSIPIPNNNTQGIAHIYTATASNLYPDGLYYIRGSKGELSITEIVSYCDPGSKANLMTGSLSGTTGTAGKITFSVNNGALIIENRATLAREFRVKFM